MLIKPTTSTPSYHVSPSLPQVRPLAIDGGWTPQSDHFERITPPAISNHALHGTQHVGWAELEGNRTKPAGNNNIRLDQAHRTVASRVTTNNGTATDILGIFFKENNDLFPPILIRAILRDKGIISPPSQHSTDDLERLIGWLKNRMLYRPEQNTQDNPEKLLSTLSLDKHPAVKQTLSALSLSSIIYFYLSWSDPINWHDSSLPVHALQGSMGLMGATYLIVSQIVSIQNIYTQSIISVENRINTKNSIENEKHINNELKKALSDDQVCLDLLEFLVKMIEEDKFPAFSIKEMQIKNDLTALDTVIKNLTHHLTTESGDLNSDLIQKAKDLLEESKKRKQDLEIFKISVLDTQKKKLISILKSLINRFEIEQSIRSAQKFIQDPTNIASSDFDFDKLKKQLTTIRDALNEVNSL